MRSAGDIGGPVSGPHEEHAASESRETIRCFSSPSWISLRVAPYSGRSARYAIIHRLSPACLSQAPSFLSPSVELWPTMKVMCLAF